MRVIKKKKKSDGVIYLIFLCDFKRTVLRILGSLWSKCLWFASTKLCFKILEFSLAPLVLIPASSSSNLPCLPSSVVTKCSHFSLGPFNFVSLLSFSGQRLSFSLHCLGASFLPVTEVKKTTLT